MTCIAYVFPRLLLHTNFPMHQLSHQRSDVMRFFQINIPSSSHAESSYTLSMRALFFPAPYADYQLLCSLCDTKQGHTLILRAPNTTRFSSRSSNFTPRLLQKRSQKVKRPNISWGGGACPQSPQAGALRAL